MATNLQTNVDSDLAKLKSQCELALEQYTQGNGVPKFSEVSQPQASDSFDGTQNAEAKIAALMAKCELAMVKHSRKTGVPIFAATELDHSELSGLTQKPTQAGLRDASMVPSKPTTKRKKLGEFFTYMRPSPRYAFGVPIVLILVSVFTLPGRLIIADLSPVGQMPRVATEVEVNNTFRSHQNHQTSFKNIYDVRKYRTASVKMKQ